MSRLSFVTRAFTWKACGQAREPIRLLIATDIASEGINLHHLSSKLIHFDIPWSLMVFQQRNGRIDRYGQEHPPVIVYLTTRSSVEKIAGDERILELLTIKDEQAQKNIGDPSAFQGVFDEMDQELQTARAIEQGKTAEQYEAELEQNAKATDFLAEMFADFATPAAEQTRAVTRQHDLPSLFPSDLDYLIAGLERAGTVEFDVDRERETVSLTLNNDLRRIFRRALPREAIPATGRIHLTTSRRFVQDKIREARDAEKTWPDVHLLWDLHPVVEWLNYKLLINFGRAEAPVVSLRGALEPGELLFSCRVRFPTAKPSRLSIRGSPSTFRAGRFAAFSPSRNSSISRASERRHTPTQAPRQTSAPFPSCCPKRFVTRASGCPNAEPRSMPHWPRNLPPTKPASKISTPLATASLTSLSRKAPLPGFGCSRSAPKAGTSTPSSPTIAITSARPSKPKTLRFSA
jgi:hypothetical protein